MNTKKTNVEEAQQARFPIQNENQYVNNHRTSEELPGHAHQAGVRPQGLELLWEYPPLVQQNARRRKLLLDQREPRLKRRVLMLVFDFSGLEKVFRYLIHSTAGATWKNSNK